MNYMGYLCREVYEDDRVTQRHLAGQLGISLGKCNSLVRQAMELGYIRVENGVNTLTPEGLAYLEQYRVKNAIIHAAGIDVRFVPFSHEQPKSLLEVEGERLIERIIRQLREKGIRDITVIVGYLAEKMEYLTDKYGVKLVFNHDYATKSNLAGIYRTRDIMGNSYLINADFWMYENLFHEFEPESWIACHAHEGLTDEWCLSIDGKRRIRAMQQGGMDKLVKRGPVYIDEVTARAMEPVVAKAYAMPGMAVLRWEYALVQHLDEIALYANIQPQGMVHDFASVEELHKFEAHGNAPRVEETLRKVAAVLGTETQNIKNVTWLDVSTANRMFHFSFMGEEYVGRIPHKTTGRFTTYKQEALVYKALQPLQATEAVTLFDVNTGIKLSEYYPLAKNLSGECIESLKGLVTLLRRIHQSGAKARHYFNIGNTLRQYDAMCRREASVHFEDYDQVWKALEGPLATIESAGVEQAVLCHINAEMYDILCAPDGSLRLANWEYSGMCHPLADIAMTALFFNCGAEKLDTLLQWYLERPATNEERRLCQSFAAVGGILWSLYGEHSQYEGDDFVAYAVRNYGLGKQYLRCLGCL